MGISTSKKSGKKLSKPSDEDKIIVNKSDDEATTAFIANEPVRKSQKVKVFISTFRYGDKIVSALGIPHASYEVEHRISKKNLKPEEIFNIISALTNEPYYKNSTDGRWKTTIKYALDQESPEIPIPKQKASILSSHSIGKLTHEILNVEIELFLK